MDLVFLLYDLKPKNSVVFRGTIGMTLICGKDALSLKLCLTPGLSSNKGFVSNTAVIFAVEVVIIYLLKEVYLFFGLLNVPIFS